MKMARKNNARGDFKIFIRGDALYVETTTCSSQPLSIALRSWRDKQAKAPISGLTYFGHVTGNPEVIGAIFSFLFADHSPHAESSPGQITDRPEVSILGL